MTPATIQSQGQTLAGVVSRPGRVEVGPDGWWRVCYVNGDALTSGKARTQISMEPAAFDGVSFAFQLGSKTVGEQWKLTPRGVSPVLIWQLRDAARTQPILSLTVDTDPADASRLALTVAYKPNDQMAGPVGVGMAFGLAPDAPVRVAIAADLAVTVDGRSVSGPLQAVPTGHHESWGVYAYNGADPMTAPTRVVYFRWQS